MVDGVILQESRDRRLDGDSWLTLFFCFCDLVVDPMCVFFPAVDIQHTPCLPS